MSKGSSCLLCALVLLQVCIVARLFLLLGGAQIGDVFLCQDPIRRSCLMSSRGLDEFGDGGNADSSTDDELSYEEAALAGVEYMSDDGDVLSVPAGAEADAEEDEGLLLLDADDGGGGDGGGAKDNSSGEHGSSGDVECPECGKFFKNDKSMFGHLRSHPNRGYKGATPPVKKLKLSPDTDAESPALLSSGDDRPLTRYSQRDPSLTPFETFCACVMLTLRYRDSQAVEQVPPPLPSVSERKLDAVEQSEGGIGGLVTSNATAELKNNAGPQVDNAMLHNDEHGGSIVKIPKKRRMNMSKEAREAHRKVKLVTTTKEKRPYVCKHCKAEFPTHQALGGHMAGHHREKKTPVLNDKPTFQAHQGTVAQSQSGKQAQGGDRSWREGLSLLSRHLQAEQLPMALNMGWQSGQAPGGHMTELFGRSNDGSSPPVLAPPIADGDRRAPLNIDLNVEAPEQD